MRGPSRRSISRLFSYLDRAQHKRKHFPIPISRSCYGTCCVSHRVLEVPFHPNCTRDPLLTTAMGNCFSVGPSTKRCSFLERIPAELRNEIYKLAFTTNSAKVDLFSTPPPSKALILTCRKVYEEARGFYKAAYQSYWKNTNFAIDGNTIELEAISRLREDDLQHITRLAASWLSPRRTTHHFELLSLNGAWRHTFLRTNGTYLHHFHQICAPEGVHKITFCIHSRADFTLMWAEDEQPKPSMKQQLEYLAWRCGRVTY